MHHMLFCAMYAYGLQRTLILESSNWRYNKAGWDAVFLPVSETCTKTKGTVAIFKSKSLASRQPGKIKVQKTHVLLSQVTWKI